MRAVELLGEDADDLGACRVGEALELLEVFIERLERPGPLERRADEQRALDGRRDENESA
jgi:hypothetical protein